MKKEFIWLKEVDSTSLQMLLRNLDTAFKNFFQGRADRPKFKVVEAGKVLGYNQGALISA